MLRIWINLQKNYSSLRIKYAIKDLRDLCEYKAYKRSPEILRDALNFAQRNFYHKSEKEFLIMSQKIIVY